MITRKRLMGTGVTLLMAGLVFWMFSLQWEDELAGLVPDNASWYVEIDEPLSVIKSIRRGSNALGNNRFDLLESWKTEIKELEALMALHPGLVPHLQSGTLGISAHSLAGKEAGYVYFLKIKPNEQAELWKQLTSSFSPQKGFQVEEREYLGKTILEITDRRSRKTFSITSLGEPVVASASGFLVEEVIRHSGVLFKPGFASRLRKEARYAAISKKPMRLFCNLKLLPDFFKRFIAPPASLYTLLSLPGDALVLGFSPLEPGTWKSEGYMLSDPQKEKIHNPSPMDLGLDQYLPNPEILSFHIQLPHLWQSLHTGNGGKEGLQATLASALYDEAVFGLSEGEGLKKFNRIFLAKIRDANRLRQFFDASGDVTRGDNLFRESYHGTWIFQHQNPKLAQSIGGPILADWTPAFFAIQGSVLLISDEVETLRRALNPDGELVSKKEASNPNHISLLWATHHSLPMLLDLSTAAFKPRLSGWIPFLKNIEEVRLKDLGESENPAVSLEIDWKVSLEQKTGFQQVRKIFLDSTLISRPYRLESQFGQNPLWVVQDIKNQTHLLSRDLTLQRTLSWPEPWCSPPQLLDHPEPGKQKILLSMPRAIRVYQTNGQMEPEFPSLSPDSLQSFEHTRLIDYDHSFQYRIFAASRYGPVFGYDLSGKSLPEWGPWKWDSPLVFAPRHFRIGEKDLIVMMDRDGRLLVTNRKGQMQAGFPYLISGRSVQPFFFEEGLRLADSYLYVLTDLGLMQKINLEGKEVSRIQLFRPEKNTRFQLLPDQKQKTFWVARITDTKVSFLDQGYRSVFDHPHQGGSFILQHFQFGASNKILAVTDLTLRSTRLYNETGARIQNEDLESTQGIDLMPIEKSRYRFCVYSVFENRVTASEFSKD